MEQESFQMINTRTYALNGGCGGVGVGAVGVGVGWTIRETTRKQSSQSKGSNLVGETDFP